MNERVRMADCEIDESDVEAVTAVLRSGRLALGPKCAEFERAVAARTGVRHAIVVSSGTAALHLIVRALGIRPGDEVLVPSFTFAASVNAILFEGATPVFVDVEQDTLNLDPLDVAAKVGPRTRAIMGVDVFGHPAEWDALVEVAREHDLRVIDDSCEALGATYRGRPIGSIGDAAAFAFYPNKQITTGEGGVVVTDDDDVARLCRSMRNQGRGDMGAWLAHERLGFNYRLDEMSAALGASQIARLDRFLAERERVARMYDARLRGLDWVRPPVVRPHVGVSRFVYVVTLTEGIDRDPVIAHMESHGVPSRGYFAPIHTQHYVREALGDLSGTLPVTEDVGSRTIALPFHTRVTEEDINVVVDALEDAVKSTTGGGDGR